MRVSVFGLGYVGCVTSACLAKGAIDVVGVDVNEAKVDLVNSADSPVLEPGLDALISDAVAAGRLRATRDGNGAVLDTDVSLVCVGTPSNSNGSLDLRHVESVCSEIGAALAGKNQWHLVVIRSTVLPGTVERNLIPLLEAHSGKRVGSGFGVCMNPEFLREGSAIDDYFLPSLVVIGESDTRSGDVLERLYNTVMTRPFRTSIATAEMVKYTCNAFHALKVAFANEIGSIARRNDVDGRVVMDIFSSDRLLNVSTAYLRPGFAFGGSCLPKDMRALLYRAMEQDVKVPLLEGALMSNQEHIQRATELVQQSGSKRVGILGLSFKNGTDDVRESPAVAVAETLVGRGYDVSIFDDDVDPQRLVGANRAALERELPHIAALMRASVEDVLAQCDVIVVTKSSSKFRDLGPRLREGQKIVDLVGIDSETGSIAEGAYEGICW
jgi:GDP-mannose 6-dehydrogenase